MAEWKCLIPKVYILYESIYITSLKWQNYRTGAQISSCQGWRREWGKKGWGRENKKVPWVILVELEMFCILTASISIACLCYCAIVLQHVAIWVKVGEGCMRSLYYFLQTHVNLQLSQNNKNLKTNQSVKKKKTQKYINCANVEKLWFRRKARHAKWGS